MFPISEVSPHRDAVEVEQFGDKELKYQLYAGHILGGQLSRVAPDADCFTILRQPAELAISLYYFRREVAGPDLDFAASCRNNSLAEMAQSGSSKSLFYLRERLTRQLGATWRENGEEAELEGVDLETVRRRQRACAGAVLDRMILVGDHRDIDGATLLLAALRGWAAPPPRLRIHDYKAPTQSDATDPAIRAALNPLLVSDNEIYAAARAAIDAVRPRLAALCGEATPTAVDAHHKKRFFAETSTLHAFRANADAGWSGAGWDVRESDGLGNLYRQMTGARATTLIRLDSEYAEPRTLEVMIWHTGSQAALEGLSLSVAGAPLPFNGRGWLGPALVLEWTLPAEIVRAQGGELEVTLKRSDVGGGDFLWFCGLGCRPAGPALEASP